MFSLRCTHCIPIGHCGREETAGVKHQLFYASSQSGLIGQNELHAPLHGQEAAECGEATTHLCLPQRIPTRIWSQGEQMFCT